MSEERTPTPAEEARTEAEARKAAAEARKADAEARKAEIEAEKAEREAAQAAAGDSRNHVYRFIGPVTGSSVAACVSKLTEWSRLDPGCDIEIVFSSPGGSIFDGFILYDFVRGLAAKGHRITTGTLGMAASMAGVLLPMGDHRWVGNQAMVLIHRAAFGIAGKSYEVEDEIVLVKRLEKRIINIYVERSGGKLTAAKIKRNWDRKDWWLEAEEALELGVVDEIR